MNEMEELSSLAQVAEIAERFEDAAKYMEDLIKKKKEDLTKEEKNIFYNSNKYIINSKRCALRTTNILEEKEKKHSTQYIPIVTNYKNILESEINDISKNIINIINIYLLKKTLSDESKVFYLKMKADYCRYICEIINTNENQTYVEESEKCYKEANDLVQNFPWTNPIRLGLSLNYSVFYYEIKKNVNQAIKIAKEAIKGAKKQFDKIKEEEDKDGGVTLQTLKENVLIWEKE
jgi:predicted O-linked N-acetylglucosamine transferase (SPINDLY family)